MVKGIDLTIESLKEQLNTIKEKISQCRKKGLDTKIAELKLMVIPSKIKIVEVTRDYKEVQQINKLLNDAISEVNIIDLESLNNKDKYEASKDNTIEEIFALMEKVDSLLKENRIKEAKGYYLKCINIYKNLSEENKRGIFKQLNDLRTKIIRG